MELGNITVTSEPDGLGLAQKNGKVTLTFENGKLKSIIRAVMSEENVSSLAGKSIQVSKTVMCWFKRKGVQFSTNESFVVLDYSQFKDLNSLLLESGLTLAIRNKYERKLVTNFVTLLKSLPDEKRKTILKSLKSKDEYVCKKVTSIVVRSSRLPMRNEYVVFVTRNLLAEKADFIDLYLYVATMR